MVLMATKEPIKCRAVAPNARQAIIEIGGERLIPHGRLAFAGGVRAIVLRILRRPSR
jgi:hypothetical protein